MNSNGSGPDAFAAQGAKVEEFHTLLANVMRRYLEKKHGLPVRHLTTPEFGLLLEREPKLSDAQKAFLRPFFEQCDLAKFAGAAVPEATCRAERWRQACDFVRLAATR